MSNEALLKVEGLRAGYGHTPILQGVDLEIGKGEIVSLIGRNGVGKTTTMRCLMGQIGASAGSIRFLGRDITRLSSDDRARAGIGFVPQGREVFPKLTVEENLMVGRLVGGPQGRKLDDDIYRFFPRLRERMKQLAGTMSGGEQQQLAIGRAMVMRPRLLLLDEPTEGIQPSIIQDIGRAIKYLRDRGDMAIVLVEQFFDFARDLADDFIVMERGQVIRAGGRADLEGDEVRNLLTV